MRRHLLIGASALALGMSPALAQNDNRAAAGNCTCPAAERTAETNGDAEARAGDDFGRIGSARDAVGDTPVDPALSGSVEDNSAWPDEMPFPAQDVSDDDLEPDGTPYPSGYPEWAEAGSEGRDIIKEGEQIPADIEEYRGEWERDPDEAGDATASDDAMRDEEDAAAAPREAAEDRQRRSATAREATGERRLRIAREALRQALAVEPDVRFTSYDFERKDGRRVVEITGVDPASGNTVSVDVYTRGGVHAIAEEIDLDEVPDDVREAVRAELGRFRVVETRKSMRRDFDLRYEFDGYAETGRPATVTIGADGSDLSVRYLGRG